MCSATQGMLAAAPAGLAKNKAVCMAVALSDVEAGAQLADSLFKNDSPDPASIRRQNN